MLSSQGPCSRPARRDGLDDPAVHERRGRTSLPSITTSCPRASWEIIRMHPKRGRRAGAAVASSPPVPVPYLLVVVPRWSPEGDDPTRAGQPPPSRRRADLLAAYEPRSTARRRPAEPSRLRCRTPVAPREVCRSGCLLRGQLIILMAQLRSCWTSGRRSSPASTELSSSLSTCRRRSRPHRGSDAPPSCRATRLPTSGPPPPAVPTSSPSDHAAGG